MTRDKKYTIEIVGWEKYQREMKGGENRKRRREWVAISTGLLHDPDFFRLTIEQRYLWVMLLCYAGAVGPVFELSASDARVLFKLRRSAVFEPLRDQGFINLRIATRQDKTRHNKTDSKATAKKKKKTTNTHSRFNDFWAAYPNKKSKPQALKVWERDNLDLLADKIIAHVEKRKVSDEQWTKDGGRFIPHPSTFLNNQKWEDEWGAITTITPIKHRKPEVVTEEQRRRDAEKANRELAALMEKRK